MKRIAKVGQIIVMIGVLASAALGLFMMLYTGDTHWLWFCVPILFFIAL